MRAATARSLPAVASLMAICALASCGSDEEPNEVEPTSSRIDLVVGDIVPLTGPDAGLGVSAQKAAQLAVEEINDAIGEADADHSVEIVHEDDTVGGSGTAARRLLKSGADCILGPWSPDGMKRAARETGVDGRSLLISPQVSLGRLIRGEAEDSGPISVLPALGRQRTLSSEAPREEDASASFSRLYATTDPPIGPPRTTDARQFDSVVLCYLAAVAMGRENGRALPLALDSGPVDGPRLTWRALPEAIEALTRGEPVVYAGITLRRGIVPPGSDESLLPEPLP
jgi:hypothetical protein